MMAMQLIRANQKQQVAAGARLRANRLAQTIQWEVLNMKIDVFKIEMSAPDDVRELKRMIDAPCQSMGLTQEAKG